MLLDLPIGVVISNVAFSGRYRYHRVSPVISPFPAESTL
jgi:hypothetical protein